METALFSHCLNAPAKTNQKNVLGFSILPQMMLCWACCHQGVISALCIIIQGFQSKLFPSSHLMKSETIGNEGYPFAITTK